LEHGIPDTLPHDNHAVSRAKLATLDLREGTAVERRPFQSCRHPSRVILQEAPFRFPETGTACLQE
jgi:hypothetical protein